MTCACSASDFT